MPGRIRSGSGPIASRLASQIRCQCRVTSSGPAPVGSVLRAMFQRVSPGRTSTSPTGGATGSCGTRAASTWVGATDRRAGPTGRSGIGRPARIDRSSAPDPRAWPTSSEPPGAAVAGAAPATRAMPQASSTARRTARGQVSRLNRTPVSASTTTAVVVIQPQATQTARTDAAPSATSASNGTPPRNRSCARTRSGTRRRRRTPATRVAVVSTRAQRGSEGAGAGAVRPVSCRRVNMPDAFVCFCLLQSRTVDEVCQSAIHRGTLGSCCRVAGVPAAARARQSAQSSAVGAT